MTTLYSADEDRRGVVSRLRAPPEARHDDIGGRARDLLKRALPIMRASTVMPPREDGSALSHAAVSEPPADHRGGPMSSRSLGVSVWDPDVVDLSTCCIEGIDNPSWEKTLDPAGIVFTWACCDLQIRYQGYGGPTTNPELIRWLHAGKQSLLPMRSEPVIDIHGAVVGVRLAHDGPCVFVDSQCRCGRLDLGIT